MAGKWKKGESGNPAGRPPGARAKLSGAYIDVLCRDFVEHGEAVIEQVRQSNPEAYLKAIGNLVPRDHRFEGTLGAKIEFSATERAARLAAILTAGSLVGDRQPSDNGTAEVDATGGTTDGCPE